MSWVAWIASGLGAKILDIISWAKKRFPIYLALGFSTESDCEWVYVIDLDKEKLEVYSGHEKKTTGHRFEDIGDGAAIVPSPISSFRFYELQGLSSEGKFEGIIEAAIERRKVAQLQEEVVKLQKVVVELAKFQHDERTGGNGDDIGDDTDDTTQTSMSSARGNCQEETTHRRGAWPRAGYRQQ
jgi:hypothetical protein